MSAEQLLSRTCSLAEVYIRCADSLLLLDAAGLLQGLAGKGPAETSQQGIRALLNIQPQAGKCKAVVQVQ